MKTFIINYKAYKEGIDRGIEIAMAAKEAGEEFGVGIIVAVPFTLCRGAAKITRAISQGISPVEPGPATGQVSWYEVLKSGCVGSLINHSENRMAMGDIEKAVSLCRKNGLLSYVCVADMDEARRVASFGPAAIAYESKELIGAAMKEGGKSVAAAKGDVVKGFVELVHSNSKSLALIGAGIKDASDVAKSMELGSDGIIVSSVIMKGDFKRKIKELAGAL
ncbi:MAG TPA: triose-phosphate isomerase [Candidatus Saccharimonadales bacterium]|nr:triose-phosphate isomerase [Candidatus Saccharimonadales bacterium]